MAALLPGISWRPLAATSDTIIQLEEVILTYLPSCLVFLLTPVLFIHGQHKRAHPRGGWLMWLKLYCATGLVALEIASAILRCLSDDFHSKRELPTMTIDLIIAASVAAALYQERHRAIQASVFLGLHLALGVFVDSTKSRAYSRHPDTLGVGYLSAVSAAVRLVLLVLNEIPKGATLVNGRLRKPATKESSSGFWGRALFLWINSTVLLGFRTRLTVGDLDELSTELSSATLSHRFKTRWHDAENDPKRSLDAVCSQALMRPLLAVALPRFALAVCSLAQPFLLQRLLSAVQTDELAKFTEDSILQAFFLLYFCLAVSKVSYHHASGRLVTQLRGILVAEILDKSHTLSQEESMNSTALTLIDRDVEGVTAGTRHMFEIPFNIMEAVLGISCLALFVGKACLMVVLPLLFSLTVGICMGKRSSLGLATWNEKIRHRVSETSKVLSQMRVIRMLGLGPTLSAYLQQLREDEIASARSHRASRTVINASQIFTPTIAPVLVVGAAFAWTSMGKLSVTEVFPSLAAVAIIQKPLYTLLASSSRVETTRSCFKSIQNYLELEEDEDPRILVEPLTNSDEEKADDFQQETPATAIEFIDVTLLSKNSESEVLKQANFALARGSITAALGPSGSGKSALLQSLVGDANVADGFIYVDEGTIGYADQSPWIRNVSVRANIVGELAFDAVWYATVLRVCLLVEDLKYLPGGDGYLAGTRGMNLSGGQRHRISLARALYCRARILVLDDIFSALDRKTAMSILFQLCGENGLLRNAGSTVILATYLPECLEVVDQLLLLDGHGGITLETDFHDEWFRANLVQALNNQTPAMVPEMEDKEKAAIQRSLEFQDSSASSSVATTTTRRSFSLSLCAFFIDSVGGSTFSVWLLSVFLVSLGESVPDIFIRIWISAAPDNVAYFAGYVGASIFATLAMASSFIILYYYLTPRASANLHQRLTKVVMHSTLAFFSCVDTGTILNRYSEDMNSIMTHLPLYAYQFFYMLFHIIIQALIIGSGTTYMVTVLPFISAIAGTLLYFFLQTSYQVRSMEQESKTSLCNHFTETARGLRHIKVMGCQSLNLKAGLALLDSSQKTIYAASCLQRWLCLAADLLACGVCLVLTSLSLKNRLTTPVPAIGLSYLILITLSLSLEHFFNSCADLVGSVNTLSKLQHFMENTPTEPELDPVEVPLNWPHQGQIELRNVTAKYHSSTPARLEDVSLHIVAGKKIGITGRSGSGKSSLFMSILGFLEYSGTIEIDGVDISKISRDMLRSRIITISQDHLDLGGTLRNNLLPFKINLPSANDAQSDAEIREVLGSVGLLSRVDAQGGLNTLLSKIGLSHGQLQLLSIARAILRGKEIHSKVVLMDEATSNVDLETDAQIQKVLRKSFAGCTILMIAHRLETIQDADMFVEVAQGEAHVVKN